ncbi:MAG: carboxypeptidase-like regulatory domain-containing protein [Bryobacteraceae bacterium]
MRFIAAVSLVAGISAGSLAAQTSVFQPGKPLTSLPEMPIQPFKLDSAGLEGILFDCTPTTLAGAGQEIQKKAKRALAEATVAAVVEFLSAVEGPEGKAASKFVPILIKNLSVPTAVALLGSFEMQVYQGRGYRLNDPFEVCSPAVGPKDLTVLWPAVTSAKSFAAGSSDLSQPLPTIPADVFSRLKSGQPLDSSWLQSIQPPTCSPPPPVYRPSPLIDTYAALSGRVFDISEQKSPRFGAKMPDPFSPAGGARVDLVGPTSASCITPPGGGFNFEILLEGSYTLQVSQSGYQTSKSSLTLYVGREVKDFDVHLALP